MGVLYLLSPGKGSPSFSQRWFAAQRQAAKVERAVAWERAKEVAAASGSPVQTASIVAAKVFCYRYTLR